MKAAARQAIRPSVGAIVDRARAVLGDDLPRSARDRTEIDNETLTAVIDALTDRIPGLPAARHPEAARLTLDLIDLRAEVRAAAIRRQTRRFADVNAGLARLGHVTSSTALLEGVCPEIVRSCGFTRAMISGIEDDCWMPWNAHFADDRAFEAEFVDVIRLARIPLRDLTLERQLLEEFRAEHIQDAHGDTRTHASIMTFSRTSSFVAAPVPAGDIVGFIHADHTATGPTVTAEDRDAIWAFAQGFGRLFERAILQERLDQQRKNVRETLAGLESTMDALCNAELELATSADEHPVAVHRAAASASDLPAQFDATLTRREREVLALLLAGHSNQTIGQHLVIAEGTAKTHVKHILRKIGAANRTEAISRYARMRHPQ